MSLRQQTNFREFLYEELSYKGLFFIFNGFSDLFRSVFPANRLRVTIFFEKWLKFKIFTCFPFLSLKIDFWIVVELCHSVSS